MFVRSPDVSPRITLQRWMHVRNILVHARVQRNNIIRRQAINFHFASFHFLASYLSGIVLHRIYFPAASLEFMPTQINTIVNIGEIKNEVQ